MLKITYSNIISLWKILKPSLSFKPDEWYDQKHIKSQENIQLLSYTKWLKLHKWLSLGSSECDIVSILLIQVWKDI